MNVRITKLKNKLTQKMYQSSGSRIFHSDPFKTMNALDEAIDKNISALLQKKKPKKKDEKGEEGKEKKEQKKEDKK